MLQALCSGPQWTEGLARCIDRALDRAVWQHVAIYGYTMWMWYVYLSYVCLPELTDIDRE
jgi:hypothetical protein